MAIANPKARVETPAAPADPLPPEPTDRLAKAALIWTERRRRWAAPLAVVFILLVPVVAVALFYFLEILHAARCRGGCMSDQFDRIWIELGAPVLLAAAIVGLVATAAFFLVGIWSAHRTRSRRVRDYATSLGPRLQAMKDWYARRMVPPNQFQDVKHRIDSFMAGEADGETAFTAGQGLSRAAWISIVGGIAIAVGVLPFTLDWLHEPSIAMALWSSPLFLMPVLVASFALARGAALKANGHGRLRAGLQRIEQLETAAMEAARRGPA